MSVTSAMKRKRDQAAKLTRHRPDWRSIDLRSVRGLHLRDRIKFARQLTIANWRFTVRCGTLLRRTLIYQAKLLNAARQWFRSPHFELKGIRAYMPPSRVGACPISGLRLDAVDVGYQTDRSYFDKVLVRTSKGSRKIMSRPTGKHKAESKAQGIPQHILDKEYIKYDVAYLNVESTRKALDAAFNEKIVSKVELKWIAQVYPEIPRNLLKRVLPNKITRTQ